MDEMYRMLGREHEGDLEREAAKWRRAAEVRERPAAEATADRARLQERVQLAVGRVASWAAGRGRSQSVRPSAKRLL